MATVTQTPYGTYTHGIPARSEGASYRALWYRVDTWTPTRDWGSGWGTSDRLRCASKDDRKGGFSPRASYGDSSPVESVPEASADLFFWHSSS